MSRADLPAALLLVLSLAACVSQPGAADLPEGQRIGEPLETREILRFSVVEADPPAHFEQTLLVEATIVAVCQSKGCWMKIEDGGSTAMVRWDTGCGGRYAFPADAAGRRVLVQGSFYPKTISEADARHIQDEADRPIEVPLEGYELNASAVLLLPAG